MSSIFIWKADRPLTPVSSTIRYYHGVDWFLEEREDTSSSYHYIAQEVTSEYIVYVAKAMQSDWMGEDLLEVKEIPYRIIRQAPGISFLQMGSWFRCIYDHGCEDDTVSTDTHWAAVQAFSKDGIVPDTPKRVDIPYPPLYGGGDQGRGGQGGRGGQRGRGQRGRGDQRGPHRVLLRI